jgi:hypothetical protein
MLRLDNAAKEHPAVHAGMGAVLCRRDERIARCKLRVRDATFRYSDGERQDVFAVLPAVREVRAVAGLFTVVDRVEAPARAAGYEVEVLAWRSLAKPGESRGRGCGRARGLVVPWWMGALAVR